mgnify:CR=1 FL=1
MEFAIWNNPNRGAVALWEHDGNAVTVGELVDQSNQVARNLRRLGLKRGDAVAMCMRNSADVYVLNFAISQIGLYLIPINWHLTRNEVAYILEDSEAKAVVCSGDLAELFPEGVEHRFCTEAVDGFITFDDLKSGTVEPPEDRTAGGIMNYTSGTTGKPKGVKRPLPPGPPEPIVTAYAMFLLMFGMQPGAGVQLVGSPLYHTAVLYFSSSALHLGHQLVVMDKWTAEGMLERIQKYKVTNSHMVPTQFNRLLNVPNRLDYDVSSLQHMVHGAAPCPASIKLQMLDWWGETVYEYYAATEGGGTMVTPAEWRARPGTVGKPWQTAEIKIFDDDGNELGADVIGTVYIKMAQGFEYHKDRQKTAKAHNTAGFFTVGDAGYLDSEGYLFLCDRKADMIISGGVNIYPAEIESVLITHPRVLDVAVFGIPDDDWGEQVKAVIEPIGGYEDGLESEILGWARENIAKYKCPKSIDFVAEMPRDPNGKLTKRKLRDPYWDDLGRQI